MLGIHTHFILKTIIELTFSAFDSYFLPGIEDAISPVVFSALKATTEQSRAFIHFNCLSKTTESVQRIALQLPKESMSSSAAARQSTFDASPQLCDASTIEAALILSQASKSSGNIGGFVAPPIMLLAQTVEYTNGDPDSDCLDKKAAAESDVPTCSIAMSRCTAAFQTFAARPAADNSQVSSANNGISTEALQSLAAVSIMESARLTHWAGISESEPERETNCAAPRRL